MSKQLLILNTVRLIKLTSACNGTESQNITARAQICMLDFVDLHFSACSR